MIGYADILRQTIQAVGEAGDVLRRELHQPEGPRGHGDHAEVDEMVEQLLRSRLLLIHACNFRGEETGSVVGPDTTHLWLVDPNDGTSDFLKGWRGSAVSVALLREGVPVLGVVYAFAYPDGAGDLVAWAEGCPLSRNGVEIKTDLPNRSLPPLVYVSRSADNNSVANAESVKPWRYVALPSIAYRLARVAAGDGVAAVCLNRPNGWDLAGGHALLRGAGAVLVDGKGDEVRYTPDGTCTVTDCFGGTPDAVRELCRRDWKPVFTRPPRPGPPFALVRPVRGRLCANDAMLGRAQGCLLGQLAGDALGGLVEFKSVEIIRTRYPDGCRDLADGGTWDNLAGQPTDDSEMALVLARTLVHTGRYDRGGALGAYVHWFRGPGVWDIGGTIRLALGAAARGSTPEERLRLAEEAADRNRPSNGSLMRISPVGIFGAGRPAQAAAWARQDSALTHPDPICVGSCAVYVAAIARGIAGGSAEECYQEALAEAERSNVPAEVRKALEAARLFPPADFVTLMGWVLIALQNAFHRLLNAKSLEEGIVDTVMSGGDTDTTAAIAGALLGAVHGRQAIPSRWLHALLSCRTLSGTRHPRTEEYWPVDALELAEALLCVGAQHS